MSKSRSRLRGLAAGDDDAPHRGAGLNDEPGDAFAPTLLDGPPDDWDAEAALAPDAYDYPYPARRLHAARPAAGGRRLGDAVVAALDRVFRPRPYLWSERAWRRSWWRRRARALPLVGLCLLLLLGTGTFAFVLASRAAASMTAQPPKAHVAPLSPAGTSRQSRQSRATPLPTPEAPAYLLGVWASSSPAAGQPVQIFVRISQGDGPMAGVPVSLAAHLGGGYAPLGTQSTDGYGLTVFTLPSAGAPNVPVVVSASATVGGQALSGTFQFLPQPPSAAPSPTPPAPPPPTPPAPPPLVP